MSRHADAAESDVGDAARPAGPKKFQRQPEGPSWRWEGVQRIHPHLGGRLPTFHDKPEPFGGPFRRAGQALRYRRVICV